MKKVIMMFLLLAAVSSADARKAYCVVESSDAGKYVKVQLGEGDKKELLDDDGKTIKFETYAALLDYMAKRGWEFKQLAVLDRGHYVTVLEKEVSSDEEVQKGIKTK